MVRMKIQIFCDGKKRFSAEKDFEDELQGMQEVSRINLERQLMDCAKCGCPDCIGYVNELSLLVSKYRV